MQIDVFKDHSDKPVLIKKRTFLEATWVMHNVAAHICVGFDE